MICVAYVLYASLSYGTDTIEKHLRSCLCSATAAHLYMFKLDHIRIQQQLCYSDTKGHTFSIPASTVSSMGYYSLVLPVNALIGIYCVLSLSPLVHDSIPVDHLFDPSVEFKYLFGRMAVSPAESHVTKGKGFSSHPYMT